ncbi:DUF418 domain-containing protein [Sphingobium cloacae]|uniref:DUF418 domain-containing protein n=1 Tax=Sphingobium cloacae TaxID=120107 RepID=A0A1E1F6K7_9SPHN|nr:DUF418 domain-containing protein [Sphingobium cloacae]BAV66149.1 hypothetical protein SCLO_1031090 [Sphingobium cloacae]
MNAPSSRILSMDVLRGVGVMGILWMNITIFALPQPAYFNPAVSGSLSAGDIAFWAVGFLFFDGKMRGLFALLFGASMLLLIDREEMTGRDGRRAQIVRAGWLFAFGLAHYLLLWWGDILMTYAIAGLVALGFVRREPLSLVKWAFLFFLLHFLLCAAFIISLYGWSHAAAAHGAAADIRDGFAQFTAPYADPRNSAVQAEIATYRSGFGTILRHHLAGYPGQWLWTFLFTALESLGFMLLGMAMLKAGFLTGRWKAEQYWRTARHCFLIGLPPMAALALWVILSRFAVLTALGSMLAWSFPFRIPLTVGWAALILWLLSSRGRSRVAAVTAAAGRMAFSNYLGTSLAMTAIFYGWGLGLFGHVRPATLFLFILGGWAVMLVWSSLWLKRFVSGPLEWLWRSLASGKMQKIRRNI